MNEEEHRAYHKRLLYIFVTILFLLVFGASFYHYIEGWRFIDALYFAAATMTTVGYGDITVKTDIGKIFSIFYMFTSAGIALYGLSVFGSHIVEEREDIFVSRLMASKKHTKSFQDGLMKLFSLDSGKMVRYHEKSFRNQEKKK